MAEDNSESNADRVDPSIRRRLRWQFVLVAFLLVILAIRIALPEVAARALERVMSQALNVEFTAGDVDLDVLEGWVAVEAVVMRAEGSNAVLARGARVVIDADWGALIAGELRAERIEIEGPGLFFEIDEAGNLNWDALGGPERQPSEAPPGPRKRGTFRVTSEALEIGAGTVVLVDRSQGGSPEPFAISGETRSLIKSCQRCERRCTRLKKSIRLKRNPLLQFPFESPHPMSVASG